LAALSVYECEQQLPGLAIPRPETYLVLRFTPGSRDGFEIHALGARQHVQRKVVRGGQRMVTARLQLGRVQSVLGVPASLIAGRVVALDELWGQSATQRLFDQVAQSPTTSDAASILGRAITQRFTQARLHDPRRRLVNEAANKLTDHSVQSAASSLGLSERQLRRIFTESVGISPKKFAMLTRFSRALAAARSAPAANWAQIAASAGYYDQAHLIGDFRLLAAATPQSLLSELRTSLSLG
jgi:AraC-like DNA-binding protein